MALAQIAFTPALLATLRAAKSEVSEEKTRAVRSQRGAVELGVWSAVATAFQAYGLEHTSATHSGFILGCVNVMVPTLAVLQGDEVRRETWLACVATFVGVLVIAYDSVSSGALEGGGDANISIAMSGLSEALRGDVSVFCAALCYAALTLRASNYAKDFTAAELMGTKTLVMTVFMFLWYCQTSASGSENASFAFLLNPTVALAVVYSAYVPGALANFIQLKGQALIPASEAQVVYASTPVFNALVSVVALGETLSTNTILGGAVILCASLAPFIDVSSPKEKTT
jgi:drug/metabolite transporter (DMT)-like permease